MIRGVLMGILASLLMASCESSSSTTLRDPMFEEHAQQRMPTLIQADQQATDIRIALLGDSHFEFMDVDLLPVKAINLGIRGDTVYAIRQRMSDYETIRNSEVIALSLGTNNVAQNVSNRTTVKQIRELTDQLADKTILLTLLNPLSLDKGFADFNEELLDLNRRLENSYAQSDHVILINPMAPMSQDAFRLSSDYYQADGIHFSSFGYRQWLMQWHSALESIF